MKISFTKMHGLGNDFLVFNAMNTPFTLNPEHLQKLSDRRFGVGCDQFLIVAPARNSAHDFAYRIFNADGGEVEHCGNGARCFLRYVREKNLTTKKSVHVEVMRGVIILTENDNGEVTVDMGAPRFAPADVEFDASNLYFSRASAEKPTCGDFENSGHEKVWELPLENATAQIGIVSVGNPHAVQVVDDIDTAPVATLGPQIQSHARFAHGVNAGFMQIMNPHEIKLRVYERGSGETLACGTGACAAVASGIARGLLQSPVLVRTRGGDLSIAWGGAANAPLLMTGPATTVFEGTLDI